MLYVHRAERADRLVEALAAVLAEPLDDPLTAEVVAVPSRGVERWLGQALAASLGTTPGRRDGVCANVKFPFPSRLVSGSVADVSGIDRNADPWLPERAVWPLLDVVDECRGKAWLASLAAHLQGHTLDADGSPAHDEDPALGARRFSAVRHIADLYDRYGVHRPQMLLRWVAGEDGDVDGLPLPADLRWQARLWRHLRGRIGTPSPAERLTPACERLTAEAELVDLPQRLSLFGLTRLPASYLAVLAALAVRRDVHLFLLHPSPVLWERVAATLRSTAVSLRRREDPTAGMATNPLLASWGRDAREMQLVVSAQARGAGDEHRGLASVASTLLGRIQADVSADAAPPGAALSRQPDARPLLDPADDSLRIHSCHGRARQVEVIRDAVLHLLADKPDLEPRDVIVMCPDIETFAPLIHAAFGAGEVEDGGDDQEAAASGVRPTGLRVRLADRSLRQTNPLLRVVAELLELADARLTASQVLDFAGRDPVRRRFGFTDSDLERLEEWVPAAGIRWGIDGEHRAPFQLAAVTTNTWRAGLDRVLLGAAMAADDLRLVGGVLPVDDVGSGDIDLAGRLAELVERLAARLDSLRGPQPLAAWLRAIAAAADLLTATAPHEFWQRSQLARLLDDVTAEGDVAGDDAAGDANSGALLALAEVRSLFADRLRGRPTHTNFRTGSLTICTLVPMRSVPHRVVCLLGLDDGAFPRHTGPDGDDLVDRDPHVGDRSPRSEDRQLLLDALLAAREHLVVTYTGRDERTNVERPPAVPVGELLDVVDATVRSGRVGADGVELPAREVVVVRHPLQPFDPRNFTAGLAAPGPWSFDRVALDGARALTAQPRPLEPFLPGPLPDAGNDVVELEDLVRFVRHPVRAFLRQRLGVSLSDRDEEPADALPVHLEGLQRWAVGQRLLEGRLAGHDAATCEAAERSRGTLPPGALAAALLGEIGGSVDALVAAAGTVIELDTEPASVEVDVLLDSGCSLVGTVADVTGDRLHAVTYSRVAPKHRLVAWLRLLAITAAFPERAFSAVTVGRRSRGRGVTVATIDCLAEGAVARRDRAREKLELLVDLYRRGMREPLPLYCETSAAYAEAIQLGNDPAPAARKAWTSDHDWAREDREPEHQLVLGGTVPVDDLLVAPPAAGEDGHGWPAGERSRFGRYAVRLWGDLLACEQVSRR